MYNIILLIIFLVFLKPALGQKPENQERFPFNKLSIEPAIGTRFTSLMGSADVQVSTLAQYNIYRRLSIIGHTSFSFDLPAGRFKDVKQNYSYSISQKFGFGTSFNGRRTAHGFYILGGLKYLSYSGTLINSEFDDQVTTKTSSLTSDYGFMYNLKAGRKKYFFSGRIYFPLKDGVNGLIENSTIELGVGFRIR